MNSLGVWSLRTRSAAGVLDPGPRAISDCSSPHYSQRNPPWFHHPFWWVGSLQSAGCAAGPLRSPRCQSPAQFCRSCHWRMHESHRSILVEGETTIQANVRYFHRPRALLLGRIHVAWALRTRSGIGIQEYADSHRWTISPALTSALRFSLIDFYKEFVRRFQFLFRNSSFLKFALFYSFHSISSSFLPISYSFHSIFYSFHSISYSFHSISYNIHFFNAFILTKYSSIVIPQIFLNYYFIQKMTWNLVSYLYFIYL